MVTRARIEVLTRTRDEAHRELHDALATLERDFVAQQRRDDGDAEIEFVITQENVARRARKSDGAVRYHGRIIGVWRTSSFGERTLNEGLAEAGLANAEGERPGRRVFGLMVFVSGQPYTLSFAEPPTVAEVVVAALDQHGRASYLPPDDEWQVTDAGGSPVGRDQIATECRPPLYLNPAPGVGG